MEFFGYILQNWGQILARLLRHIEIVGLSIPFSIAIGVPVGIGIANRPKLSKVVLYIASVLMTIPSLALFGFMVIFLAPLKAGIGMTPAVIALIIYSMLPIVRNTLIAIKGVDPGMIEVARGMGMTKRQILFKVRMPFAVSVIMAGVRSAAVLDVSVATIAYLIGAGGLGYYIFVGISRTNLNMVLTGTVFVALLGIGTNFGLLKVEDVLTPRGIKISRGKNVRASIRKNRKWRFEGNEKECEK